MLTPELVARLGEELGAPLTRVRPLRGETGAVSALLGEQAVVVKATPDPSPWAPHTARVLRALHEGGAPVPLELHRRRLGRLTCVVQPLLPGSPPPVLPAPAWDALRRVHAAQRGLAARLDLPRPGATWTDAVRAEVDPRGPWADRWAALARSCAGGAAFVDGARARLASSPPPALPEDDVVHGDLHHGNLLTVGEQLTGVVDWDDVRPGDARADLVTLLLSARATADDPDLGEVLLPLVRDGLEPGLRWLYAVRDVVRFVGWFALRHPGWDVPGWLVALEAVIDDLA